jgi:U3 small nucleolar RNA-associated protein 21
MFDHLDGMPRLLRSRSGHHSPPTFIRHYDPEGRFMLSAGRDRALRLFAVFRDEQNVELSQGSLSKKAKSLNKSAEELKLPYAVQFASCTPESRSTLLIMQLRSNSAIGTMLFRVI